MLARVKRMWDSAKIKALRNRYGETQEQFAERLGVVVDTLRYWEQGRGQPKGPAEKLLTILDRNLKDRPVAV